MTSTEPALGRPTRQRRAITAALESAAEFRTAQEIHAQLEAQGARVGLSTVYRTLQSLADAGEVDSLRTEAGESSYRRCSATHHHHLVCRSCGTAVEIEGPAVERWTRAVAEQSAFRDVSHTLEIFGTCAAC
ncbi:Fur family transcriptional regulator [Nocardioides aurantiacus]|jgi:Fur family transcriptional regulator, ferric uptake regulator|uniref:Fur family transcriptional regulator n=1 Tax=Nocardioides aurantiacus TaxID=86796 RepID=UPI00403F2D16